MLRWRVWYADKSFSSFDTEWCSLPDGIQIVKVYYLKEWKPGRPYTQQLDGKDWYYLINGIIEGVPSIAWGEHRPPPCGVPLENIKRGTGVDDETFAHLTALAAEAKTWP